MNTALEIIQNCEVSGVKVSVRGQNLRIDAPKGLPDSIKESLKKHKADVIRHLSEKFSAPVQLPINETLQQTLNRLIVRDVSFDTSENDFTVCREDLLTVDERKFIEANQPLILCTLQQGILARDVFARDERKLREFQFDVFERQSIIGESESDEQRIYFDAVADVSKRWFAELLNEV